MSYRVEKPCDHGNTGLRGSDLAMNLLPSTQWQAGYFELVR